MITTRITSSTPHSYDDDYGEDEDADNDYEGPEADYDEYEEEGDDGDYSMAGAGYAVANN